MERISAVVLTKNEQANIRRCLKSLSWCSETIVIDDYSEDKTVKIAKEFGAKVYRRHLEGDFSRQRNFGLEIADGEWVLFIDADEVIGDGLAEEIAHKIKDDNLSGYFIKRSDSWLGKKLKHGEWGEIKLLRLGKKKRGKWFRKVHEVWKINGNTDILRNKITHYPHSTIKIFLVHLSFHSSLHGEENELEGKKSNILKIIFYPIAKFNINYIWRRGFLEGTHGFVLSTLMSFHSFLSWSEQWLESRK